MTVELSDAQLDELVARMRHWECDDIGDPLSQERYDDILAAADAIVSLRERVAAAEKDQAKYLRLMGDDECCTAWANRAEANAAPAAQSIPREPDGYAYEYEGYRGLVIRFNNGEPVNGSSPLRSIPYWLGRDAAPKSKP